MTPFQRALAAGKSTLRQIKGESVEYLRYTPQGDVVVPLNARRGSTPFRIDSADRFNLLVRSRDWIVTVTDLAIDGETFLPDPHDRIRVTIGEQIRTYRLTRFGDEPEWRYTDSTETEIRLHTALIDSTTPDP
jgi:hypothetical protein